MVVSRSMSFGQHTSFILHLTKGLFAQPLTNENTTRCKTSCISSLVITKHSEFTLALLVSNVFLFRTLFNWYYAALLFAIWKLILGIHTFDPVLALIVILISSVVYVTPASILKLKLSSNIISSTSSPSCTETQSCFFACQLMSRLN